MKAVIFAGGVGTRLWPLSRKKSPKQFEAIVDDKSTLQLTFDLLTRNLKPEDIFISTGLGYVELVAGQLPKLPRENIIAEPSKKDVGPAVGLVMAHLQRKHPNEPVIILWSDHLIKKEDIFLDVLKTAEDIIREENNKIVFIGHKPRFASENLGWIEYGEEIKNKNNMSAYAFTSFKYKPHKEQAEEFFTSGKHAWNLGYWVTTPQFMYGLYKQFAPEIYAHTEAIMKTEGTEHYTATLKDHYEAMPSIHFDHAIVEKIDPATAYVMTVDIGWTDIGAWESLKNALEENQKDNVTNGRVLLKDCEDTLIYNYDEKKLIVCMDLEDFIVINTNDVLLVTKKGSVPKITDLVKSLEGTEHEDLT